MEQPDPTTPYLNVLIEAARQDWRAWGDRLVREVESFLKGKRSLSATERASLRWLFRRHQVELTIRFAGRSADDEGLARLLHERPDLRAHVEGGRNFVELSHRLGRSWMEGEGQKASPPVLHTPPTLRETLRRAAATPRTARDEGELAYVQTRGEIYMRRPAVLATSEAERVLNDLEYRAVRGATDEMLRWKMGAKAGGRVLRESVVGLPTLINDMDRVARTELAFANHGGALVDLEERAEEIGEPDPQVFKIVSPGACRDCLRIWGEPGDPIIYQLSDIKNNSNFRKPRAEWVATIGPTHPHCTCPPVSRYDAIVMAAVRDAHRRLGTHGALAA